MYFLFVAVRQPDCRKASNIICVFFVRVGLSLGQLNMLNTFGKIFFKDLNLITLLLQLKLD